MSVLLDVAANHASGSSVPLKFTIKNSGKSSVHVLKWNTPLSGHSHGALRVTSEGKPLRYRGILSLRGNPVASDYVEVPAGGEVSATVNLAEEYDFVNAGEYEISFEGRLHDVVAGGPLEGRSLEELVHAAVSVEAKTFSVQTPVAPRPTETPPVGADPTYTQCSSDQENKLSAGLSLVATYAPTAAENIDSANESNWGGEEVRKRFLGAWDATRYATITTVTTGVSNSTAATATAIDFNCSGGASAPCAVDASYCADHESTIAFTCGSPRVFVCPHFDTQTSYTDDHIVYHEIAHWFGPRDPFYGCKDCCNNASSDPNGAVNNADNYAWFAQKLNDGSNTCGIEHFLIALPLIVMLVMLLAAYQRRRGPPRTSPSLLTLIPKAFLVRCLAVGPVVALYYWLDWAWLSSATRTLVEYTLALVGQSPTIVDGSAAPALSLNESVYSFTAHCTYADLFLVLALFAWRFGRGAAEGAVTLLSLAAAVVVVNLARITGSLLVHQGSVVDWNVAHHYPDVAIHVLAISVTVVMAFFTDTRSQTSSAEVR